MMNFVLKMMSFLFKMMKFVFKMMNFELNMMDFAGHEKIIKTGADLQTRVKLH